MKKFLISGFFCFYVSGVLADSYVVEDKHKSVINRTPYKVEVCTEQSVSGDKTADALTGAIIGGIIGNNVGNVENGGAIGSVLGGIIGHNNSKAKGGTKTVCSIETRYNEEVITVYSHSIITFDYEGRKYSLEFKK